MINLGEHRTRPDRLSDFLVWSHFEASGVIRQKTGALQTSFRVRGPDLDRATPGEMRSHTARLNNIFKRLAHGFALFFEARRRRTHVYPESGAMREPVASMLDAVRRRGFEKGAHFESQTYLTLVYQRPKRATHWLEQAFFGEHGAHATDAKKELQHFMDVRRTLRSMLEAVFVEVVELDDDQMLTYLHGAVSTKRQKVTAPKVPAYLDCWVADQPVEFGLDVKLGESLVGVVSVPGYPAQLTDAALDGLNRLGLEYRWVTRWVCLSKEQGTQEIKSMRRAWYSQRHGLRSLLGEAAGVGGSELQNEDVVERARDAGEAAARLGLDEVAAGRLTLTLVVEARQRAELEDKLTRVEEVLSAEGFITVRETLGAGRAWLGTHPGNTQANPRRPLMFSDNLAALIPSTDVWAGPTSSKHLGGPVHAMVRTKGETPFRLDLGVGDVGHTFIVGPTGSGKSTLLSFLCAQWLRHAHSRVVFFDKGKSARCMTRALGGRWVGLNLEDHAFQPLRHMERDAGFLVAWLANLTGSQARAAIQSGLKQLAGMEAEQRTLSGFRRLVQDQDIKQALAPFVHDGEYNGIFDGAEDAVETARVTCFEMAEVAQYAELVPHLLNYLFMRLDRQFDGRPTLLVLDEAWLFLDNPLFASRIRQWLKTLRKKRVYVVFATQSIADAVHSSVADAVLENCPTRIFLSNPRASEPSQASWYQSMGLNATEIALLSASMPKRDYYYSSPLGARMFQLSLSEVELAFVGASSPDDQKRMDRMAHVDSGVAFAAQWLRARAMTDWADVLEERAQGGRQ